MRLSGSVARTLVRPVGACLVVFALWALPDHIVLTQQPAPAPPPGPGDGRGAAPPAAPAGRGGRGLENNPTAQKALAAMRAPLDRLTPVTDAMLRESAARRLAHWRRTLQRVGKQPADPGQSQHREGLEGCVDVEPEFDRRSGERVHAARARRHHVHVELRRDDSGARREERQPALAVHPRAAEGLPFATRISTERSGTSRSAAARSSCRRLTCGSSRWT